MSKADIVVSESMGEIAQEVDLLLNRIAGHRMNFTLLVFNTDINSRVNYVSNCDREDVVTALKTLLEHWDDEMEDVPAHKVN